MPRLGFRPMKYMGHKGKMLPFLWEILSQRLEGVNAFADPFCGSGAVSWYLATRAPIKVVAGDLQLYAAIRSAAVVERTEIVKDSKIKIEQWFGRAKYELEEVVNLFPWGMKGFLQTTDNQTEMIAYVKRCRNFCSEVFSKLENSHNFGVTCAYGGYYFSPLQALILDALRATVPEEPVLKNVFLAALIDAASKCVASPGHTAQPFQPTMASIRYIKEAWKRDVWKVVSSSAEEISNLCARKKGWVVNGDYHECLNLLSPGDMVFADPPYSDVQYSRFYHVLETLAKGGAVPVTGAGRYPALSSRPASEFSRRSSAHNAALDLITSCAERGLRLVITFPTAKSSNGLSACEFKYIAERLYPSVEEYFFESKFSTLGGNGINRKGRMNSKESILCMDF